MLRWIPSKLLVFTTGKSQRMWQRSNISWGSVKNGLSNLTKVQDGWDQYRNDVGSDFLSKALKEGCQERTRAWKGVSPTEKTDTNKDLARVMAKV